jgi:hypothetical protein
MKDKYTQRECVTHGVTRYRLDGGKGVDRERYRCVKCSTAATDRNRWRNKRLLVDEAGGCCQICGYNKSLAALEFHHLDPSLKSYALGHANFARSLDTLRQEAAKCQLVCANCHRELEYPAR